MKKIALIALLSIFASCSDDKEKNDVQKMSIAQLAKITPAYSDFSRSLDSLGLTSTFENAGDYTVFMPTNDALSTAISALGFPSLDQVFTTQEGKDALTNILKYHVVASRVASTSLSNNQNVSTLNGQNLTVTIADVPSEEITYIGETNIITLNGNNTDVETTATVIARDVECTNGVIHPIDGVLVPATSAGRRK